MKFLLVLSMLATLASCSKEHKRKSPGIFSPNTENTTLPPLEPDTDGTNGDDQTQTDSSGDLVKPYEGPILTLSAGKDGDGRILIVGKDAARIYSRLAIRAEGAKGQTKTKVAKHISCTEEACTIKINYKEAEVKANEEVGEHARKIILIAKSYKGANFTLLGKKKIGIITLDGIDAKKLFESMKVPTGIITEESKSFEEKKGLGEAPIACRKQTDLPVAEFNCEIRFHAPDGVVFIP